MSKNASTNLQIRILPETKMSSPSAHNVQRRQQLRAKNKRLAETPTKPSGNPAKGCRRTCGPKRISKDAQSQRANGLKLSAAEDERQDRHSEPSKRAKLSIPEDKWQNDFHGFFKSGENGGATEAHMRSCK